ncbi:hypothetical protein NQZ68_024838, partial [Dissostichus eleginoides]
RPTTKLLRHSAMLPCRWRRRMSTGGWKPSARDNAAVQIVSVFLTIKGKQIQKPVNFLSQAWNDAGLKGAITFNQIRSSVSTQKERREVAKSMCHDQATATKYYVHLPNKNEGPASSASKLWKWPSRLKEAALKQALKGRSLFTMKGWTPSTVFPPICRDKSCLNICLKAYCTPTEELVDKLEEELLDKLEEELAQELKQELEVANKHLTEKDRRQVAKAMCHDQNTLEHFYVALPDKATGFGPANSASRLWSWL